MRSQTSLNAELFARALRMGILGVFALFVVVSLLSLFHPAPTSAATSSTLNFQARLETSTGAIVPDGNYNVEFKLYTTSTVTGTPDQGACTYNGGTADSNCLWVETRTGANQVKVANGYLTVNLGSVTSFPTTINWNQQLWLTMRIGGTSGTPTWDAEMSPRIQLTAVPYAFQAGALGNGTNQAVLDASGNLVFQQASTVKEIQNPSTGAGLQLTIQGGAGNGGTNVGGNLLLQGGAGVSTGASGSVIVKPGGNDSTTAFQVQNAAGTATVLDADTANTRVGIGTASPDTTLHVVTNDSNLGGILLENTYNAIAGSSFAPLIVQHDSNTNGDTAGIRFRLNNSTGSTTTYAYIGARIESNTAGSEAGDIVLQAGQSGGALQQVATLNKNGLGIQIGTAFSPQYPLQVIGDTSGAAVGPLVVQSTASGSSIGAALTLDASPATGGHKWSFLSTGPGAAAGAGSFSFFDGTANAYRLTIGTTGNVGVGITAPTNLFQVGPQDAFGNATRTNGSATLVGSLTGWTSAQVGDIITFPGGTTNTVVSVTDNTHLTMGTTYTGTTDSSPVSFVMYKPAFNVTSSGNAYVQSTSTTAFQVQNASGGGVLTVDTTNTKLTFNAGQNGALGAFSTNANPLTASLYQITSVSANGYLYVLGGADGSVSPQNTVYYAKINADGSTGTWTTSSHNLPDGLRAGVAAASNGYIYYVSGINGSGVTGTVYYAKLNADGSTSTWNPTTSLPAAVGAPGVTIANGYIYSIGNHDSPYTNVYYAKLNADGTVGAWNSGPSLTTGKMAEGVAVANGFVYAIGGIDDSTGSTTSSIYYAKLNADGSLGSWTTSTTSLPNPRNGFVSGVANGYVYVAAGYDGTSGTNTVYYAKLNADGSLGAFSTNANNIPQGQDSPAGVIVNGNLYVIGGKTGGSTVTATVYYASTARLSVAGDLDLIGLTSGQLAGPTSTGGSIYSGSIYSNGDLSIQGNARLWNGLSVSGVFNASGNVLFTNTTNSTTAFQIQNASSASLLSADTTNNRIVLGSGAGASVTLLVLGNKSDSGDPTGVAGAMYYNASLGRFRCYEAAAWRNCDGGTSSEFGDGSDGSVTFDGTTTILGMAPSSNTYTLTRDIFCVNITINSGITVLSNGFRIFATGTVTNNGTISANGGNGTDATLSTNGQGGSSPTFFYQGSVGGQGGAAAAGSPGNTTTSGQFGGNGGRGGTNTNAGGTGGSSSPAQAAGGIQAIKVYSVAVSGEVQWNSSLSAMELIGGGGSGGGGGSSSTSNRGGGGGGGGGVLFIAAWSIVNNGTISANGGNGGNGNGSGGVGGGGGGGLVMTFSTSYSGNAGVANGGNAGTTGSTTGATNGGAGRVLQETI